MSYYTIRGFSGQFYGEFEDRNEAETYAEREIIGGWDIVLVDHQFVLQCLIDVLSWYTKEDYEDINVKASVKNSLDCLNSIWGLSPVLPNEPTEDPMYQPAMISNEDFETLKKEDQKALANWIAATNSTMGEGMKL